MRVLFVSPRTRTNRYSGEDAYTDSLMAAPPPGVTYVHYEDLIAAGKARRARWVQRLLPRISRALRGPLWVESLVTDETDFDLIHIHGFSVFLGGKLGRARRPILLSESSLDLENLVDYDGWPRPAVRRFAAAKRLVMRGLAIYDQTLNLRDARALSVWSDWARRLHTDWGIPDALLSVIPPPVSGVGCGPGVVGKAGPPHFLFVGMDFQRKNGPKVLEAFREARRHDLPDARLTLVGERERDLDDPAGGVRHIPHLPRERLFQEIYPTADVFLLPSRAEGYGISVVEAMSAGLPCIVSGFGPLPEIVGDTGWVTEPVTVDGLREAMTYLGSDPARRAAQGAAARARFLQVWSKEKTRDPLAALYHRVANGTK